LRAPDIAGRVDPRERWRVRKTSDASTPLPELGGQHMVRRWVGGGRCGRRSRVVLASVADAKSAEVRRAQPGANGPSIREATVTKRNSSPGRARRKPLKPFACGNAGLFRWTCGDYRVLTTNAHGLRVPLSTRHSPRPQRAEEIAKLGQSVPREHFRSSSPGLTNGQRVSDVSEQVSAMSPG
jgi:hypothetical protein